MTISSTICIKFVLTLGGAGGTGNNKTTKFEQCVKCATLETKLQLAANIKVEAMNDDSDNMGLMGGFSQGRLKVILAIHD